MLQISLTILLLIVSYILIVPIIISFSVDSSLSRALRIKFFPFDIRIDNLNTGAGVRIKGDQPLSKLVFWGSSTTLCPETYINIKIEPGEDFNWSYFYEFYISDIPKQ